MSVMRWPLIFRRPALFGLSGLEPFRHFFDAQAQCPNFLLLAKHDVAQISVRSLEERNFDLDLLKRVIVHVSSTAECLQYAFLGPRRIRIGRKRRLLLVG